MVPSEAEAKGYERASKNTKSTKYGRQNPISERWNSEEQLVLWREAWANAVNRALERAGSEERVDPRSHAARGLDEQPTIHEGVAARVIEAKGRISDRCELNRQIRQDNALLRSLKAAVQKLKAAVEATVPALADAMETVRRNIIVFWYGLLHVRDRKKEVGEYAAKASAMVEEYLAIHGRIREKQSERKAAQKELDGLGLLSVGPRRDLKARIAGLSEEIEELHTEEKTLIQAFGKEDAAGMKQVKDEIHAAEANRENLDRQENSLNDSIRAEQERFDALKEQAADLDRDELTAARLALRRDSEHQAWERIRESVSSGKVSFQRFRSSVSETDRMLGEDGTEGQEVKREHGLAGRDSYEQEL